MQGSQSSFSLFTIICYSHFFKIVKITPTGHKFIVEFALKWVHQGFRPIAKPTLDGGKHYFEFIDRDKEVRFHIGQYDAFIQFINSKHGYADLYEVTDAEQYTPEKINTRFNEEYVLYPYQVEATDFMYKNVIENDLHSRMLRLPTGKGKTVCGVYSICMRGYRAFFPILPTYMEKWVGDIKNLSNATDKDIMVVKGTSELIGLIGLALDQTITQSFIIVSLATLKRFYDSYKECPEKTVEVYGCTPEDLYSLLKIGTVLIDEAHQHLHSIYRTCCYMHVDRLLTLSATFMSEDLFIDKLQKMMFPSQIQFNNIKMDRYIEAIGLEYTISQIALKSIKCSEFRPTGMPTNKNTNSPSMLVYSQQEFEKSLIKNKKLFSKYLNIIEECVENTYLDVREAGDKILIFCYLRSMCSKVATHLQKKYPNLTVNTKIDKDPYENFIKSDIVVSTQKSAGTAIDIKGLITVVTTDNISSSVTNLQCLGRLRNIPKKRIRYVDIYSPTIQKHIQYHRARKELFSDRVVSYKEYVSPIHLTP